MKILSSTKKVIFAVFLDSTILFLFSFFNTLYSQNLFSIPFISIWIFLSYISGRYSDEDASYKVSIISDLIKSFASLLLSILVITKFNIFQLIQSNSLISLLIFFLLSFIIQLLYKIFKYKHKNKYLNWLILGSEKEILQLKNYLKEVNSPIKLNKFNLNNHDYKFNLSNYRGLIITEDECIPRDQLQKIKFLYSKIIKLTSKIKWCEYEMQRIPSELLREEQITPKYFLNNSKNLYLVLKRIGDITLSIFLLILTSPILLLSSIFIWGTDKGPIFYSQIRSGYGGKPFRVWKLRSMRVDAEKDSNPIWAAKNDPRITPIGAFLRKCRIDELPQLINVINGSMSLIGPRPERPEIEETLSKKIKNYHIRSYVKPGLSGWAQVNYPYGASVLDSKIKSSYDIFYIKHQTLLLDILIFFKTIKLIFNLKGSEPIEKKN